MLTEKKPRLLLIDDVRTEVNLQYDYGMYPSEYDITIAKNFNDGIKELNSPEGWDILMLDHDLASYDTEGRERTGYDIMNYLEANPSLKPGAIEFVTANPVGRQKMEQVRKRLYGEVNG